MSRLWVGLRSEIAYLVEPEMHEPVKAVIIGGGWAGVLAAAAVKPYAESVTVLERDPLGSAKRRRGAQGTQLHNLLTGGLLGAETLLPGFRESLRALGGIAGRVSSDTHVFEAGMWMPRRNLGFSIVSAPRSAFEHAARRALRKLGGVTVCDRTKVLDLVLQEDRVAGVIASGDGSLARHWPADLVVDASGGAFKHSGKQAVPTTRSQADRWYASLRIGRPAAFHQSSEFWLIFPSWGTRSALISPLEDKGWFVSVSGSLRNDLIPATWGDAHSFVDQLDDPTRAVPDLLSQAMASRPIASDEPLEIYRQPVAVWRRFELSGEPLAGYFPIGDTIARQSPLTGQGLSVAAQQAISLRRTASTWSDARDFASRQAAASAYLSTAAELAWRAWSLQSLGKFPNASAGSSYRASPLRFADLEGIAIKTARDPALHAAYVGLWHLVTPPDMLAALL